MRVPWSARRSNQSILKEISPEYSLEGLMLKLKLQWFDPTDSKNGLTGKDPDAGKDWRQEEKGPTEDEMVEWHHQLDGHESEQVLGVGDGQGSLECCSPWGLKESDRTEQLNWTIRIMRNNNEITSFPVTILNWFRRKIHIQNNLRFFKCNLIKIKTSYYKLWASPVAQTVKNLPAMWETWVHPWVGKLPWRKAWQPILVFLPGESSWTEGPGGLQSMGSERVRYNWD